MSRVVRQFGLFYEADSRYSLSKSTAETFARASLDVVGRHTGPLAVSNVQGLRIPERLNPLDPRKLRYGIGKYSMLYIRRSLDPAAFDDEAQAILAADPNATAISGWCQEPNGGKIVVAAQAPDIDPRGTYTIERTIHEIGHSFSLDHCCDVACSMYPTVEVLDPQSPFCDNCAGDLEIAGYQALAAQL